MGDQLKGTLTSPCDCKVQQQFAADGQYANRGQALFELVPINAQPYVLARFRFDNIDDLPIGKTVAFARSEEHTSELQSLMRISYAVFCLKKQKQRELVREIR